MDLQILVSTMHMSPDLPARMGLQGMQALFINQCGETGTREVSGFPVYDCAEHGLARSRNAALAHAQGEFVWFCDDDVTILPDAPQRIAKAFSEHPDADAILFDVTCATPGRENRPIGTEHLLQVTNALRYPSFQFVYRTKSIAQLRFDESFGSGSTFSSGEDSLFTVACLRKGLKIVALPVTVASVEHADSAWFAGFDDRYRRDKGALMAAMFGIKWPLVALSMLLRHPGWRGGKSLARAFADMRKGAKMLRGQ